MNYLFAILLIVLSLNFTFSQNPFFLEITKLEGDINTDVDEILPIYNSNDSILYFTRNFIGDFKYSSFNQEIWKSSKVSCDLFSKTQPFKELNNKFNNAIFSFNPFSNTIYLLDAYNGLKDLKKGCSTAQLNKNYDYLMSSIEIPGLDIDGDSYGFTINNKEDVIVISYLGPNSFGFEDLYISKKLKNKWSVPLHMGNTINSSGFEISPFFSKNSDTLFFSSNGFKGFGDADIYYSIRLDDSFLNWSTPINIGNSINSDSFDAYFSLYENQIFLSSNRNNNNLDIYTANIKSKIKLQGYLNVSDVSFYKGSNGKVDLNITSGNPPYIFAWSNNTINEDLENVTSGKYNVIIKDSDSNKLILSAIVNEPKYEIGEDVSTLLKLDPIYYDIGKWDLNLNSKIELDKVILFLNQNPNVVLELRSYTDCRSSEFFNLDLSNKRANTAVEYCKFHLKNKTQISGIGLGESNLLSCPCEGKYVSNCTEKEHALNRRTEFIIINI